MTALVVLAKRPEPGRVKTRLVPPLDHAEAAAVAAACLSDTLDAVDDAAGGADRWLAFDGDPTGWRRPGWRVTRQPDGGLDRRIAAAMLAVGSGAAFLVGMDTPQLTRGHLRAFDPSRWDACLGPAEDGGWWGLGLADVRVAPAALTGVPMSTPVTAAHQLHRLRALGLRVQVLDRLTDVDTVGAAQQVAATGPPGRFAASLPERHRVALRPAARRVDG